MQQVRLHLDGTGELWALSQCAACGEVDQHPLRAAASRPVHCRKCGKSMDMITTTNEAFSEEGSRITGAYLAPVRRALERAGLHGAVHELNQTVPHRYTGIFVTQGASILNVALADKLVDQPQLWPPFPLGDSFCSLIVQSGTALIVHEAGTDAREEVRTLPAGKLYQAYCGVPLIDTEGRVLGSLCHFDELPISLNVDLALMLQVSVLLGTYLWALEHPG